MRDGPECYLSQPEAHERFIPDTLRASHASAPPDVEQPHSQDTTPKFQDVTAAVRPNLSDGESRELEEPLTEYGDIFAMNSKNYRWTDRA
jgi:hypothetical protein